MEGELNKPITFSNVFGNFTGVWKNDFFYLTDDRLMNFRMDYVEITKKDSKLLCDGVLGLGYSYEQSYGNIYEVLEMTVEDALEFFSNHPKIKHKIQTNYGKDIYSNLLKILIKQIILIFFIYYHGSIIIIIILYNFHI